MDLDDLFTITCGVCKVTAPVNDWCKTEMYGQLPAGDFQCPHCQSAFRRVPKPNAKPWDKFIQLVTINPHL
jgi:hypothetical protein